MKNIFVVCYLCKEAELEVTQDILRHGEVGLESLGWRRVEPHGMACPACAAFQESVQAGGVKS